MKLSRILSEALLLPAGVLAAALILRWVHGEWALDSALLAGLGGPLIGRGIVRRACCPSRPSCCATVPQKK